MAATPTPPPCAVLFDLDGTLIDFELLSEECLNAVLRETPGVPSTAVVTRELHAGIIGMAKRDWSRQLLQQLAIPEDVLTPEAFSAGWAAHMALRYDELQLMPGAAELVATLQRRGVPMAIATSSDRKQCEAKIAVHAATLREPMGAVVCGDEVPRGKPHPDIFLAAAEKLGVAPERCVVVEDSPYGAQAGVAAGMVAVFVPDARFMDEAALSRVPAEARRVGALSDVASVLDQLTAGATALMSDGAFVTPAELVLRSALFAAREFDTATGDGHVFYRGQSSAINQLRLLPRKLELRVCDTKKKGMVAVFVPDARFMDEAALSRVPAEARPVEALADVASVLDELTASATTV
eukprot:CAMPEP_0174879364 /NCGR_PEP_ID=MMETSP1114-20130205/83223_1 /TAXON_ID=312471 /ORGANISM="Neobodo designis, Strain CCAP 1951/1" /LENGTH=351 /DNA_ID=CAMNT_0016114757 /DNA_START=47 /DNA_END=1102 /DNA_ORIENTATION=+